MTDKTSNTSNQITQPREESFAGFDDISKPKLVLLWDENTFTIITVKSGEIIHLNRARAGLLHDWLSSFLEP